MTDQTAGISNSVKQLFSPPVLAALRYLLVAISPMLALVGVVALDASQIDRIIAVAQQIGVVIGAVAAFAGVVGPVVIGAIGTFKATQTQQVKTVSEIANDPTQAQSAPAQQALVQATAAIASNRVLEKSEEAKNTLIAATVALDEVQGIVADPATANAIPSSAVMSSDTVKIVSNDSGLDTNRGRQ